LLIGIELVSLHLDLHAKGGVALLSLEEKLVVLWLVELDQILLVRIEVVALHLNFDAEIGISFLTLEEQLGIGWTASHSGHS